MTRRATRLLPAAAAAFAFVVGLSAVRGPSFGGLMRTIGHALAAVGGVGNWFVVVFPDRPGEVVRPLLHTWSLGVEEQAYALLALVLLACRRSARRVAFVFCAAGVGVSLVAGVVSSNPNVAFFSTPHRLAPLALGVGLAALLDNVSSLSGIDATGILPFGDWLGVALCVCVLPAMFLAEWTDGWLYSGGFVAVGLVFAAMVGVAALDGGGVFSRLLRSAPFQFVGARSYSLYLVHFPCAYLFGSFGLELRGLLRIVASFALAELLHRFVEFRFHRPLRSPNTRWQFAPIAMLVMGAAGFVVGSVAS